MVHNRVGPPVRGEDFFGRDGFVRQVSDKLREGNHVLLAAPRRFGKTSVMYRLIDQPLWEYHVVHVDLEGLDHAADLIARLLESTARVSPLARIVASLNALTDKLVSLIRDNAEEIDIFEVRVKLRDAIVPQWREQADALMRRVASADRPVVFFLDELPMMLDRLCRSDQGTAEAMALMRWLRALRQAPDMRSLRFVLAGSIGTQPSVVMVKRIYRDKVLGEDCKRYFDHYYTRFRLHYSPPLEKSAKRILRELAQVGEMSRDACYQLYRQEAGDEADFDIFSGLMADLEYEFYVEFDQDRRCYHFACKLLRDWWLRHYSL